MANHSDDLPILWRDHGDKAAYEAARTRVFTTKIPDRFPAAVVRPRTDAHVVGAIRLAASLGARVAVRSGGHSWACWSVRQDAVLVDLVDFRRLDYDEATRVATATTSVTSSEMTAFLGERGRFVPTGHCAGVGLGGFMLQGGMGHNSRVRSLFNCIGLIMCEALADRHGADLRSLMDLCASISSVSMLRLRMGKLSTVTSLRTRTCFGLLVAVAQVRLPSRTLLCMALSLISYPGFPGVILRFYFKTRPAPKVYKRNVYVYPIRHYEEVMRWMVKVKISHYCGYENIT